MLNFDTWPLEGRLRPGEGRLMPEEIIFLNIIASGLGV